VKKKNLSLECLPGFLSFLLLIFSPPPGILAQNQSSTGSRKVDTLAVVDGQPITSEDFLNRFEMSVYPGKDNPTYLEAEKREFLNSMIAEKLLSNAASRSNLPYTEQEEELCMVMEEIFMRDALYRQEIVPHVKISNDDLLHGFDISVYKYLVDAFYFDDSASAGSFYSLLRENSRENIYALADSLHISHDTLEIPYGESTDKIEDAFFGHRKGFVSTPVITEDGWVIFKILSRSLNERFTTGSTPDRLGRIREILAGREEEQLGNLYIESMMKDIEVSVNYEIFRPLVYAIRKIFEKKNPPSYDPYYQLNPADLTALANKFSSYLDDPLLSFKGGSLSLRKVLLELPTAMFAAKDSTVPEITFALHSSLRFISQNYFLVRRADDLGLENSQEVTYNVRMVLDAFRSYRIANEITDTVRVTQGEADKFFAEHHDEVLNSVRLKLKMYGVDNINQAIEVFDEVNKEKNDATDTLGATWINAFNLGEIGAVLSELKKGDVYGPVEDNGKFHIYQLLDKKSSIDDSAIENSIEVAKEILSAQEKRKALGRYIAKLAEDDNVKIFPQKLVDVKATPFQMLTFRYIGFGGRIIAVPQLFPREDWVKYYQYKKPPVP